MFCDIAFSFGNSLVLTLGLGRMRTISAREIREWERLKWKGKHQTMTEIIVVEWKRKSVTESREEMKKVIPKKKENRTENIIEASFPSVLLRLTLCLCRLGAREKWMRWIFLSRVVCGCGEDDDTGGDNGWWYWQCDFKQLQLDCLSQWAAADDDKQKQ